MTALAAEQREAGATVKALSAEETNELEGGITVQEVQPVLVAYSGHCSHSSIRLHGAATHEGARPRRGCRGPAFLH
jgi:hypothetical protein